MTNKPRVIVAGAGPVGLYTAHALAKANVDFVVLEQQSEIVRYRGAGTVLLPHACRLMDQIGLYTRLEEIAARMHSKSNILQNGQEFCRFHLFDPFEDHFGYACLGLSRSQLIQVLYESLPERESRVKTNARVVDIETDASGVRVHLADGSIEEGAIIIGADGVHSQTRTIMNRLARDSSSGAGEKDDYPMVASFKGLFARSRLHEGLETGLFVETHGSGLVTQSTSGKDYIYYSVVRALPTPTTVQRKYSAQEMEEEAKSISEIYIFPGIKFKDLWATTARTDATFVNLEEGIIDKWYHGRIVLLGDTVHKMTSINGLGVNTGLQSAAVLINQLHDALRSNPDLPNEAIEKAFHSYQSIQEPSCRAIVKMGMEMTRMVTWSTWTAWFFDRYVIPWMNMENQVKTQMHPFVSNAYALDFVPFESKVGQTPWNKTPKFQAAEQGTERV
ncbi:putative dehydrogenase [Hypoxylon sp. FL0543]|nr:putative dehydrogenase [Hypoxylon sp. FL0543]